MARALVIILVLQQFLDVLDTTARTGIEVSPVVPNRHSTGALQAQPARGDRRFD